VELKLWETVSDDGWGRDLGDTEGDTERDKNSWGHSTRGKGIYFWALAKRRGPAVGGDGGNNLWRHREPPVNALQGNSNFKETSWKGTRR